jgi:hypothetical protein
MWFPRILALLTGMLWGCAMVKAPHRLALSHYFADDRRGHPEAVHREQETRLSTCTQTTLRSCISHVQ